MLSESRQLYHRCTYSIIQMLILSLVFFFPGTTNASMISESAKNRPCLMRTYIFLLLIPSSYPSRNFHHIFFFISMIYFTAHIFCFYLFIILFFLFFCCCFFFFNHHFNFASTLLHLSQGASHKQITFFSLSLI